MHGQTVLSGEVLRATDAALLFSVDGRELWVPRRVCLDGDAADVGDVDLHIANWWLLKEGLL